MDNRIGRTTYFERCWPNHEWIAGFDFIRLFASEDRVFVTYEARSTSGKRFRNSEVFTLRGQQIVEVEVYFGWSLPHEVAEGSFLES